MNSLPIIHVMVLLHFSRISFKERSTAGIQESFLIQYKRLTHYSNEVFCAWDFSIDNPKSAAYQHNKFVYEIREQQKYYSTELGLKAFFLQYITSFTVVILNGTSPVVFSIFVVFEKYSALTEINISLFRNIFLSLSSFIVLLSTLYRQIACNDKDICGAGNSATCNIPRCWETYIGQLLYKLCMIDFFVYVGLFLCYDFVQRFGVFYSPLLPAIMVLKLIAVFYIKKTKVMLFCNQPEFKHRASRFNSMFISLLFISFFIVLIVLGFEIDRIQPSRGCGPFRYYTSMSEAAPKFFKDWISVLTSYWSMSFTSIILCLMIHYYWRVNASQRELAKRLRAQLVLQCHDKQYLLATIAQLTTANKS